MNKRDSIITILLIVVGLAVAHEYVPTWIEGPDGEMPSFTYSNQIQDSKGNMWLFGGASYGTSFDKEKVSFLKTNLVCR